MYIQYTRIAIYKQFENNFTMQPHSLSNTDASLRKEFEWRLCDIQNKIKCT